MLDHQKSFESAIVLAEKIVKEAFPIVGKHHTVQASNFRWQGVGSSVSYDIAAQKKAKLEDKSLLATLLADVQVVDKTGKVLDQRDGHIVLQIPHITSRASYILQGTERQVINQLRLRPGIYADFTPDNNIKVRINTSAAGTYAVLLDRESLIMTFRVGTSTNFPIISVLKVLGLNEVEIRQLLGDKIFAVNQKKSKPDMDALKLIKKLRPYHATANVDDAKKMVVDFLASKPLDPEVNKVTIGKPIDKVDQSAVVECVRKAISLATGASEPDDVESLAFKSILSFDDFVAERLLKAIPDIKRKVASLVDRKPQVLFALPPSMFTDTIDNFFNKSEFTRHADQNNPIDIAAVNSLVTTMGEGGIKSTYAVTDEVRTIHPSHLGILDVAHTSEGGNIGITNHLSLGAKKIGSALGMSVYDARTGKREDHTIQALVNKTIAYPDQYDNLGKGIPKPRGKEIKVRAGSSFKVVSPKEVDYVFTTPDSFFSSTTSAIPFLPNNHVNRVLMGDKHIEQAVNLTNPDKPLVMHEMTSGPDAPKKISAGYEELFGQMFNIKSPVKGKVTKVTADAIYIKPTTGKAVPVAIHNNYPLNSHTFFHDTPSVKVGDRVKEGQPLAESNFTKDNVLALGKNLRVAYTAYKGYNFEDGVVISEAAAQKLTSTHKHEYRVDVDKNTKTGADIFFAAFPQDLKYLRELKERYDSDGIIKKGIKVEPGDILIPAFQQIPLHAEFDYKRLGKKLGDRAIDISQRWDGLGPAEVIDVVKSRSFIKVFLKSEEPMKIGDKISMRHGGKGIITHIVPDDQMYKDESGNIVDVLLNPLGVPSRVNTGQLFETAAGKLAQKTGKPYYTKNFNETHGNTLGKLKSDLAAAGVKDAETLTDPVTGRKLPETLVGITHIYKLKHQVDTKFKARGATDESFTLDEQPAKTDESSAQRIGMLDTFSLLSGDATHFLNDAYGIKSQKNDEYWVALQRGVMPPPPKVPFITERFVTMLLGAGINLRQEGSKLTAAPLTDSQIKNMSHGEIDKPLVVKSTNLMPEKGGLFDPVKTGGIGGNRFNHIELVTPIPNPLMLDAITSVARLPKTDILTQIIDGNLAVNDQGEVVKDLNDGASFGNGVINLLKNIDVEKEITRTQAEIKTSKADKLNAAYRRLKYLRALKELKLKPVDAYTNKFVPIIPAKFRNVQPRTDGSLNVADANFGYREVIMINNQLKKLSTAGISQDNLKTLNRDLFRAVSGITGVTAPLTRAADVSGFIEKIKGPSPKMGFFQSRVLTRAQDLSARSTVIPNPKLGLDEIGLPSEMALTIYKPFVVKRLVGLGYDPLRARDMVEKRDELAIRALQSEIEDRPAIMNRAPSLHKFNLQAFKPRLIEGRAVEVNPLIVAGYNMDFDGDTAGIHVPVSEDARKEAWDKLMPSRNLFATREDSVIHAPSRETVHGLYLMTTPKGTPVPVKSVKELMDMYKDGKIEVNAAVTVGGQVQCAGQYLVDALIPDQIKLGPVQITSKNLKDLLISVAKTQESNKAGEIISKLKDLGNHYVTHVGFSISLNDLEIDRGLRDDIMTKAKQRIKEVGFNTAANEASKGVKDLVSKTKDNRFVEVSVTSGALGKLDSLAQMVGSPVAVEDHKGRVVPMLIEKSYAEGHDLGSYLATAPGARKGLVDKGLSVGETGYFNKKLVNTTIEYKIVSPDCKTTIGIDMPLSSSDIYDRFVAAGPYRNKQLTPEFVRQLTAKGKTKILVRSPMTCAAIGGLCQKCFGLDSSGKLPPIGSHIGALAGQTLGERATQTTLKAFHTGGTIGGPKLGFDRISEIVEMPETIKNKATLASVSGAVSKIEETPTGGWFVYVKDTKHFVPKELGLGVKLRQVVKAGDKLSQGGTIKPQELLEYTGSINTVRNYLVNELAQSYSKEQGAYIKRKLLETVVRPLTDKAQVTDAGGALNKFNVYPGDVLSVNLIKDYNKQLRVSKQPEIKFEPMLLGINNAPYHSQDFIGPLSHERLKQTIVRAPQFGMSTDIEKGHPMAQLALKNLRDIESTRART
jgi:DNA-directed RNA polymerase subunit beta'